MNGGEEDRTERDDFATLRRADEDGRLVMVPSRKDSTDRYQIGRTIGRGGMGEVFVARDALIGREVAIKRLRGEVPDRALDRFMREACIQGRLDHPAIVPVHDLGIDRDGVPFFVMKKLSGTTLARIFANPDPGRHSRQRLLRAFIELCLAVEFVHTRGFLHRDLKPDNIVLGEFGEVYLLDWGVAKAIGSSESVAGEPFEAPLVTRDGAVVGTAGYMAPEQVRAERDLDARADVYSLGCVLFEILAGERLHPGGAAGLHSAVSGVDARPSMRASRRDIPPELDQICVQATALSRDERPASARALAELIEKFLDGDRDLELRKRLAREHVETARQAFAAGDLTESRHTAMRLAGRALALDPTFAPAAELVGRLMLEPPREIPGEVQGTLTDDRVQAMRRTARFSMFAYGAYVVVFAMIAAAGFSIPFYAIAFGGLIALNVAVLGWYARSSVLRSPLWVLISSGAMIALLARMFSPFFIAPGVAAVTAVGLTLGVMPATVRGAATTISTMSAAILLPWLAELAGWLTPSFHSMPTQLVILSPGVQARETVSVYVFAGYAVTLVVTTVLIVYAVRRADHAVRQALHLQAWQLRQLVPVNVA